MSSFLAANSQDDEESDESSSVDDDYEPGNQEDWKKTINVGHDFQAQIQQGLCKYGDAPAYENEDRLLWDPHKMCDSEVEGYLCDVHEQNQQSTTGLAAIPKGSQTRDDEQVCF